GAFPALEGDLDGVGLGAVLQALQQHRRTGTLSVTAGRKEEKLFFARGEAFILRVEDSEADEFVNFFLGDFLEEKNLALDRLHFRGPGEHQERRQGAKHSRCIPGTTEIETPDCVGAIAFVFDLLQQRSNDARLFDLAHSLQRRGNCLFARNQTRAILAVAQHKLKRQVRIVFVTSDQQTNARERWSVIFGPGRIGEHLIQSFARHVAWAKVTNYIAQ
ncbi:MAG TPA: DUF4388 domain-containing protein, partial [Candidatus Handelsmanbacteria bacterium]|nr:DUF4388 domain-containing protein [Candidatus Handelsmanbacteria bacterium]